MSDEQLANLEDDTPAAPAGGAPAAETPPVAAAAEPGTPAPPVEGAAQVDAVEVGGQQYVPLAALKEERQKRQGLETKAARVDQLDAYFAQKQPILNLIEQNPYLLRQPEPAAPKAPDPNEDPRAVEAAKMYDFYTPEGKPDAARGAAHLAMVRAEARSIAEAIQQPERDRSLQERAQANFQMAAQIKDAGGNPINLNSLRAVWNQVLNSPNGAAILADKEAAAFVAAAAHGVMSLTNQPQMAPPARPPLLSEAPGGGPRQARPISELEQKVASERGRTPTQWQELTKGHIAGRGSVLEDN